jgi:hypothetical protein
MLEESRARLRESAARDALPSAQPAPRPAAHEGPHNLNARRTPPLAAAPPTPPPIADVLRDLYEEEKKTA